jgi:hypothetical protein
MDVKDTTIAYVLQSPLQCKFSDADKYFKCFILISLCERKEAHTVHKPQGIDKHIRWHAQINCA